MTFRISCNQTDHQTTLLTQRVTVAFTDNMVKVGTENRLIHQQKKTKNITKEVIKIKLNK